MILRGVDLKKLHKENQLKGCLSNNILVKEIDGCLKKARFEQLN